MKKTTGAALHILIYIAVTLSIDARPGELIGWSETNGDKTASHAVQLRLPNNQSRLAPQSQHARPGMEVLSWEPRIFLYRGILTDEECDHMIKKAEPRLHRSGVVGLNGGSDVSDIRTSQGMFFSREEDEVIARVERKLSEWSLIPLGNGEGIQVLKYERDQEYKPHFDYFFHEQGTDNGGNRLATVLMYLSDTEEGGETVFPNVAVPKHQNLSTGFSECSMKGLAVKPRKGDAVLFWSLRTDGVLDKGSQHGSCPVIKGTKYAATKWFHVAHYAVMGERSQKVRHVVFRPPPAPAPPGCVDKSEQCSGWADGGECENNAGFMVGTKENPGDCLYSCQRCDLILTRPPTKSKDGNSTGRAEEM